MYRRVIDAYEHARALSEGKWGGFGQFEPDYQVGSYKRDYNEILDEFGRLELWGEREAAQADLDTYVLQMRERYSKGETTPFEYRFGASELERLRKLLNEARKELQDIEGIPERWRQRMIRRLGSLQNELDERMSSLDRLWGTVGEALPVLFQMGESSEQIVERLREIMRIAMHVQAVSFGVPGLPSGSGVPFVAMLEEGVEGAVREWTINAVHPVFSSILHNMYYRRNVEGAQNQPKEAFRTPRRPVGVQCHGGERSCTVCLASAYASRL